MPFAGAFRSGMRFPDEGTIIDGFTVEAVRVEQVGSGAGRYEYPIEITVRGRGGKDGSKKALKPLFDRQVTIFSEFGNPYQCSIGPTQAERIAPECYRLTARGVGVRVNLRRELLRFLASLGREALPGGSEEAGEEARARLVDRYLDSYMADTGTRLWKPRGTSTGRGEDGTRS